MRLVLVEHGSERVCGDSAVFAARSAEWAENTFQNPSVAQLAEVAARLLDESEGRVQWRYEYSSFGPDTPGGGYDAFACSHDMDDAPPDQLQGIKNVVTKCFYMGFVRCIAPVAPIASGKRRETPEKTTSRALALKAG